MKKRFWFGMGLLFALFLMAMCLFVLTDRTLNAISADLQAAGSAIVSGDRAVGERLAQRAMQTWQGIRNAVALIADQTPMDTVDSLFQQLNVRQLLSDGELASLLSQLSGLVKTFAEAHAPYLWNLF